MALAFPLDSAPVTKGEVGWDRSWVWGWGRFGHAEFVRRGRRERVQPAGGERMRSRRRRRGKPLANRY